MDYERNKKLISVLNECAAECHHCTTACLDEQDVKMLAECIKLDIDCAEICQLTAAFLARGSEHAIHILKECAEICEACAGECGKHGHMEHCKRCAEVCRLCAEECMAVLHENVFALKRN